MRKNKAGERSTVIQAALYLRMSTDNQQYSIDNQAEAIRRYAQEHSMVIVKKYVDPGKSGLSLQK